MMEYSADQTSEAAEPTSRPTFTKEQESQIFRAAGRRVTAAVQGQRGESTRYLLAAVAETPVFGAFVTLRRAGQLRSCCGHIEASVPFYKALDHAADRAATEDPRFPPIRPDELNALDMDVWILWGPEPVKERGEDRVKAITIGKHGLLISRGFSRGLLLPGVAVEHHLDALAFLQQVCIKAGLPTDAWKKDDTELLIFEGEEIRGRLMPEESGARPAAVAGVFYPGTANEITREMDAMFAGPAPMTPQAWAGVMVPHAGWMYSGRLAASVFRCVQFPSRAIILCPKHRVPGSQWAVEPHGRWLFTGGQLDSDPELAARLAGGITGLEPDAMAHREEHAIEVQLPLLARLAPKLRVVGITVGGGGLTDLLHFGDQMAEVLQDMPERPLLIISSDMNHFADDAATRRVDRLALDAIESLDPERVYDTVWRNRISMCGIGPCVIVMKALQKLGCLNRCETVGYATSADAGGPTDRVVGYAGLLFG